MTIAEAKQVLLRHRDGLPANADPELVEALKLAESDAELRLWWEEHRAFQSTVRDKLRQIEVPADLKERLLVQQKVKRINFWRQPVWIAAAAAMLISLLALAVFWQQGAPDSFADYQRRMVRAALREYRMDIVTNDVTEVRKFMAFRGTPADFALTKPLSQLSLTGGGVMRWRGEPVSMLCFDRGDREMLYLFVIKRDAAKGAPRNPHLEKVNKLQTLSWTQGELSYVLAGPDVEDFQQRYFGNVVP